VRGLQERYLYSRTYFELNRAAALAEWRQLLSAPINLMLAIINLTATEAQFGNKDLLFAS
jgi:hypothetical protein